MSDARDPELELDADALAMLRAYRAEERIPAELHDRVWSRVRADVETTRVRWLRRGAMLGVLAAAAMAVLWLGGEALRDATADARTPASQAGYERRDDARETALEPRAPEPAAPPRQPSNEPPSEPRPAPTAPASPPIEPEPTTPSEPDSASSGTAASPARAGGGRRGSPAAERRPAEPTPTPGSTLAEENRLLARARAALIDEQPEQALARLAEHARRFPEGVLSEERQALRAVALCEAGRDADGDAAAQAFLREHPQAALAQRVRSACLE